MDPSRNGLEGNSGGCVPPDDTRGNAAAQEETHDVFGDPNLRMVMTFLLFLYLMQYSLLDPCTC